MWPENPDCKIAKFFFSPIFEQRHRCTKCGWFEWAPEKSNYVDNKYLNFFIYLYTISTYLHSVVCSHFKFLGNGIVLSSVQSLWGGAFAVYLANLQTGEWEKSGEPAGWNVFCCWLENNKLGASSTNYRASLLKQRMGPYK